VRCFSRIDTYLESRPQSIPVSVNHIPDPQLLETFGGSWNTNQSAAFLHHEIDLFGIDVFCRQNEIAFILTISIIDYNDHLTPRKIFNYRFYGIKTSAHNKVL